MIGISPPEGLILAIVGVILFVYFARPLGRLWGWITRIPTRHIEHNPRDSRTNRET